MRSTKELRAIADEIDGHKGEVLVEVDVYFARHGRAAPDASQRLKALAVLDHAGTLLRQAADAYDALEWD